MISVFYEKEDKKLAINIIQKLENKGFKCQNSVAVSDNENQDTNNIQLGVFVLSSKSNSSEKLMKDYEYFFDKDIPVIPFVISDLELSLSMQYFLNSHDWINAYDVNTNQAIDDLTVLINETLGMTPKPKIEKKTENKSAVQSKTKSKSNQTILVVSLSVVFAVIILYLIFGYNRNNQTENNFTNNNIINLSSSDMEKNIVGNWKLADYKDNMQRSNVEYADFINSVNLLKQNFLLKIKKDNTFEKYGFAVPESGYWQLDTQNELLYMWPPDSKNVKDMLYIEKLTSDSLIMSIATQIDSVTQVITRFSLYKE